VSVPASECTAEKDVFIRDCFDWFFYYLDRIEHFINTKYIDWVDVEAVFRPYARKILKDLDSYRRLLQDREYELALNFIDRYATACKIGLEQCAPAACEVNRLSETKKVAGVAKPS
jgi:hypothetical protein